MHLSMLTTVFYGGIRTLYDGIANGLTTEKIVIWITEKQDHSYLRPLGLVVGLMIRAGSRADWVEQDVEPGLEPAAAPVGMAVEQRAR